MIVLEKFVSGTFGAFFTVTLFSLLHSLFKNLIKTIFLLNLIIIIKWITRHHIKC